MSANDTNEIKLITKWSNNAGLLY